jgi:hypothetical protein
MPPGVPVLDHSCNKDQLEVGIGQISLSGVDRISSGGVTHQVVWWDLGIDRCGDCI